MGVPELLDTVDRAERAATAANRALWERLSCRAQLLVPEFTAQQLCRVLFAFHRAELRDEGLLQAASEALQENCCEPADFIEVAMLLKAFSRHQFLDREVVVTLLRRAAVFEGAASATDISQLMSSVVRLGAGDCLHGEGSPLSASRLFNSVVGNGGGVIQVSHTDLTNLSVAAAVLPPTSGAAAFLLEVLKRLGNSRASAATPPRDCARRLLSVAAFDEAVLRQPEARGLATGFGFEPVTRQLGSAGVWASCRVASVAIGARAGELDLETSVGALEAVARLSVLARQLPAEASQSASVGDVSGDEHLQATGASFMRPMFSLLLQRSSALPRPLLDRCVVAANHIAAAEGAVGDDEVLSELQAALGQRLGVVAAGGSCNHAGAAVC